MFDPVSRGEARRIDREAPFERAAIARGRGHIGDGRAVAANQQRLGARPRRARLMQQCEQLAADLLHAKRPTDLESRRTIALHREDRGEKCHGRAAGRAPMDVEQGGAARLGAGHEVAEAALDRRHARRGGDDATVGIEQRHSGDTDAPDVGGHVGSDGGRRESLAVGDDGEEIAKIAAPGEVRARGRRVLGKVREPAHVELDRGVLGEGADGVDLVAQPVLDSAGAGVGDHPEADLPLPQLALAFAVGIAERKKNGGQRGGGDGQYRP